MPTRQNSTLISLMNLTRTCLISAPAALLKSESLGRLPQWQTRFLTRPENVCAIYRSRQTNLFELPFGSSGRPLQISWSDGQIADPLSSHGKHRIGDRRNDRRDRRLAHAKRALRIGTDNMNFDRRRIAHSRDREIAKRALLSTAAEESDFSFQRR